MNKWGVTLATYYEIEAEDSNDAVDEAYNIFRNALSNSRLDDALGANAELIE